MKAPPLLSPDAESEDPKDPKSVSNNGFMFVRDSWTYVSVEGGEHIVFKPGHLNAHSGVLQCLSMYLTVADNEKVQTGSLKLVA